MEKRRERRRPEAKALPLMWTSAERAVAIFRPIRDGACAEASASAAGAVIGFGRRVLRRGRKAVASPLTPNAV